MSQCKSSKKESGNSVSNAKDSLTKLYIRKKDVFASAFNYFLYGGKEVIHPEQLQDVNTNGVVVPYGEDGTEIRLQPVQKIRDAFLSVMTDNHRIFMLCGIENQTLMHNAMPVRNGLYDFMEYAAQVQEAADAHRRAGNHGKDSVDFLSGFHSTDKLIPVYTLVIYWGPGEWTAPRSLFEMLDINGENDYYGLNDWKINLIIPSEITEEEALEKFGSDLGKALIYVKNMGKPEEEERIYKDERFRILRTETALVLNEIMNADFKIERKETVTDMCYAVERWKADSERKGTILGTIDTYRELRFSESEIMERIMTKYNLTEEEATEYMIKKSA